jgi:hypothetical protein
MHHKFWTQDQQENSYLSCCYYVDCVPHKFVIFFYAHNAEIKFPKYIVLFSNLLYYKIRKEFHIMCSTVANISL